ncbi:sensor histidine kinase [Ammoniphilus sp. YIM 78166]|uniref:sensor histidine kinase n=1 Tax=Ammoniphilus sp. YIM 78166 TaxID=1644106 RepID=UPI00106FCF98|nr:sensor histidine kinase [Ammoniphilus sp. YIM 78166]
MKPFITRVFFSSFKSTILTLFLPIIVICILVTGFVSYFLASSQLQENAFKSINDTVFQTKSYLDNQLRDVFEQLVALSNHPDTLSVIARHPSDIGPSDYIRMDTHLSRIASFNPIIESALIHLHDGKFVLFRSDDQWAKVRFSYPDYRERFQGGQEDFYWQNLHQDDIFISSREESEVVSVFKLIGKEQAKANGVLLFHINRDFFRNVFNDSLIGENGYLVLVNQEGVMSFKQVDEEYQLNDEVLKHLQGITKDQGRFEFQKPNGKKMLVIYDTLSVNRWKVAAVFPEEDLLKRVDYIKVVTLIVAVLLIIVAVFLASMIARYITRPISYLVNSMKGFEKGNMEVKLDVVGASEIGLLYKGVRDLVVRVNRLLDQIRAEQETKRQLELAVMQAQINPHFLYNTLYSIKGLSDMGLNKEASSMVTALSNFFRIGISRGQEIIRVQEEVEHISNYMFIQEMRYGDDFSYDIEVEPRILHGQMIKLTLQPLIENAIYHGVKQTRGIGHIQVNGYLLDEDICFEVKDNGAGMSKERLEEIRKGLSDKDPAKLGFGVRSVHERIQLHYGEKYGLTIDSEEGKGTIVKVLIPLLEG